MAKPQLVVLGFLTKKPMHGYQIGQIVEEMKLHVWAGIKLPSIYKALQTLESEGYIRGEQETEGNNPPRTVFHVNPKGTILLQKMIGEELMSSDLNPLNWWMVVSFSLQAVTKSVMLAALNQRIELITSISKKEKVGICLPRIENAELPFIMNHIFELGKRHHAAELITLQELKDDILSGEHDGFFMSEGD